MYLLVCIIFGNIRSITRSVHFNAQVFGYQAIKRGDMQIDGPRQAIAIRFISRYLRIHVGVAEHAVKQKIHYY